MKKLILGFAAIALVILVVSSLSSKLPSYDPERDYLDLEEALVKEFIFAKDSSVIELPEGHFLFSQSLSLDNKKHLTIRGKGMDKTVLSFKGQKSGAEGIKITNSQHITLEDFTIEDAAGDNLKVSETDTLIIRRIRSAWTGEVSEENGAYALYPVLSTNVLIEQSEVIGSSDAGIYVGQSDKVIIRNNKAFFNVAGVESENSTNVEIYENEVFNNTSGLLIFNLPGLTMSGGHVKAHNNLVYDNNLSNFAVKGSIVSAVPKGTGVIVMATKDVTLFDNEIKDHKTSNMSIVSYELFALEQEDAELSDEAEDRGLRGIDADFKNDLDYNPYSGRVYAYQNKFENRFFVPTFSNDFGLLWAFKNGFKIPDIAYDGIIAEDGELQDQAHLICLKNNEGASFAFLDASNDFEGFTTDVNMFECEGE